MIDEIVHTIDCLRTEFEDLTVRGLRATGADQLRRLRAAREEFERIGATHLAERIGSVVDSVSSGTRDASRALLNAQTSLRLFDRVLTLDVAESVLTESRNADADEEGDREENPPTDDMSAHEATARPSQPPAGKLDSLPPDVLPQINRMCGAIEELLLTGLTTASEATQQTLAVTFQEASRLRLLRLAGTLRIANEELGRFIKNETGFSRQRLVFFLHRAWLLGKGISHAIQNKNEAALARLLWTADAAKVDKLEVVTLGVVKKVAKGAFCAFEFRLRDVHSLTPYVWSIVFPQQPGTEVPAEAYLHVPTRQKFKPSIFLEGKTVIFERVSVSESEGGNRILLNDQSTVALGSEFTDWQRFQIWNQDAAIDRIQDHSPGPLDLEVELQEEIVLPEWTIETADDKQREGLAIYPVHSLGIDFDGSVSSGTEGEAARAVLNSQIGETRTTPLFGLLHYESCRLKFLPLTLFEQKGPRYITISDAAVDRKAILKTLKFT